MALPLSLGPAVDQDIRSTHPSPPAIPTLYCHPSRPGSPCTLSLHTRYLPLDRNEAYKCQHYPPTVTTTERTSWEHRKSIWPLHSQQRPNRPPRPAKTKAKIRMPAQSKKHRCIAAQEQVRPAFLEYFDVSAMSILLGSYRALSGRIFPFLFQLLSCQFGSPIFLTVVETKSPWLLTNMSSSLKAATHADCEERSATKARPCAQHASTLASSVNTSDPCGGATMMPGASTRTTSK